MKFLRGNITEVNQESVSSVMLMKAGLNNPDYIPTIMRAYRKSSPLNYILDVKGMKTSNVNGSTNDNKYRTIGSNHVKYRLDEDDLEIRHFKANAIGETFESVTPTTPGKGGAFYAYTDSNFDGFQEVIELADNETYLINLIDPELVTDGVYKHKYKIVGNIKADFVDIHLLEEGAEYKTRYNIHEQDFSERGVEKYSFKGWADAYLTLQRFQYSISGTASAILKNSGKVRGKFVENGSSKLAFLTELEMKMMQRASEQLNFHHVFGKSTVDTLGKTILTNNAGHDLVSGDGIFYSNGGPLRIPYNGWTKVFLQYLLTEIDEYVNQDADGYYEVVMLMAPRAYSSFQVLMGILGKTMNSNIEGTGSSKGINDTYGYYEFAGIRLIPMKEPSMRNRPRLKDEYGNYNNDMDTILLPLGLTTGNNNGVELLQLRPMSKGTVAGIDKGGNISSSVDGSSTHILFQNGIINQNKVIFLRQYTLMR